MNDIILWQSQKNEVIPKNASVEKIIMFNKCLSEKDINQLSFAYKSELYEMSASFIWEKTMNKLREYILSFGNEFALEMLGMSDSAILNKIPEKYAIDLSYDLGVIPKIGKIKLTQCNEMMAYYLSPTVEDEMDSTTINLIIRVCVEYVLQQDIQFGDIEFCSFRNKLMQESFTMQSPVLDTIKNSPYFYKKTIIRTLLNLVDTVKGIELDNAYNNFSVILPNIWDGLSTEDKWLVGTAYTEAVNVNNTRKVAVFKNILLKLKGFDYVPENVRSNTFIDAAKQLIAVHNAMNNYYNEPAAVHYLASLGSVVPGPAVGICISALLCVKIGNSYGVSFDAQNKCDELLKSIGEEKYKYYLNNILSFDEMILEKLKIKACIERWCELEVNNNLNEVKTSNVLVNKLIIATREKNYSEIRSSAEKITAKLYK